MRTLLCVALFALCAGGLHAQVVIEFNAVPPLPPDGVIPPHLTGHSVFVDLRTDEIVVLKPGRTLSDAGRFGLHNGAEPEVTVTVSKDNADYVYDYAVTCSTRSRRPLRDWALLTPVDLRRQVRTPEGWSPSVEASDDVDRTAVGHVPLELLTFTAKAGAELAPGSSVARFQIRSPLAPGYITLFARSHATRELPANFLAAQPPEIRSDLTAVLALHSDRRMLTVAGPRFAPEAPQFARSMSFYHSLQHLAGSGRLKSSSPFVRAALSALSAVEARVNLGGVAKLTPSDLTFLNNATSPEEKEVARVLHLSLSDASDGN